ncbi:MAG TPA: response regulator [Anaerolineales bacterium]|nr:response regulator [Anaerolineales bacterium]
MAEKILIIDDDIDTLKLVGLMLERQGYQIAVASNGTVGISKAETEQPGLILLDVMMPDLDGYEVTRRLRSDPSVSHIPIIMFTAKTMVDDKVAGFEAGVDDYLTKPTHPAELTAHVKAVLARSAQARATPSDRARVIGFLGAKGGVGTSTLALNVGVELQHRGQDVIIAEFNPGRGTIGMDLNIPHPDGLSHLLTRALKDIHLRSVESELVTHRTGVRLLLSSYLAKESELEQAISQMEAVVGNLSSMATTLVLDVGAGLRPYVLPLLKLCDHVVMAMEPVYPSNIVGRALIEELESSGIGRHKISLALVTRERTSLQIPWRQVEADLGVELGGIISPAPEQAHQASQSSSPLVVLYPETLVSDQIRKLTDHLASQLQLVET